MNAASPESGLVGGHQGALAAEDVPLSRIRPGAKDKLGNLIQEVFWCGANYTVYRTDRGVFVHFSDNPREAAQQRRAFTEICPELCELRYLTAQMASRVTIFGIPISGRGAEDSIFDHNIAQAVMLLMEGKGREARDIADSALKLAVSRATNDNTIRYVRAAIECLIFVVAVLSAAAWADTAYAKGVVEDYLLAAGAGAVGAFFSIVTRLQSFELKPCQESNMNYLVSMMRIVMGALSAVFLVLLAKTPLGNALIDGKILASPVGVAVVGFLGGFAERLVQTIAQRSADAMGERGGTPVQVARNAQAAAQGAAPAAAAAITAVPVDAVVVSGSPAAPAPAATPASAAADALGPAVAHAAPVATPSTPRRAGPALRPATATGD